MLSTPSDIVGPYQVPLSYTSCWMDEDGLFNAAMDAAKNAGVNTGSYDRHIVIFPRACDDNLLGFARYGPPGQVWINGYNEVPAYVHELGHTFGFPHALILDCKDPSGESTPISSPDQCTRNSTDYYDIMGFIPSDGTPPKHYQGPFKMGSGWIPEARVLRIKSFGEYSVSMKPTEYSASSGYQIVEVPKLNQPGATYQNSYYIEMRKRFGFDNRLAGADNKILIRVWDGQLTSFITGQGGYIGIDTGIVNAHAGRSGQIELVPGERFYDPFNNILIFYQGVAGDTANLFVGYYNPGVAAPTIVRQSSISLDGQRQFFRNCRFYANRTDPRSQVVCPAEYSGFSLPAEANPAAAYNVFLYNNNKKLRQTYISSNGMTQFFRTCDFEYGSIYNCTGFSTFGISTMRGTSGETYGAYNTILFGGEGSLRQTFYDLTGNIAYYRTCGWDSSSGGVVPNTCGSASFLSFTSKPPYGGYGGLLYNNETKLRQTFISTDGKTRSIRICDFNSGTASNCTPLVVDSAPNVPWGDYNEISY